MNTTAKIQSTTLPKQSPNIAAGGKVLPAVPVLQQKPKEQEEKPVQMMAATAAPLTRYAEPAADSISLTRFAVQKKEAEKPQARDKAEKKDSALGAPVQRKILTKNGEYDAEDKLPKLPKYNHALGDAANSDKTWFVENNADLQAIGSERGGQLVGPYIHVVGEQHHLSRWGAIENKWGFTKKITCEDVSDSKSVPSSEAAHTVRTNPNRPRENMLENLHAKTIVDLALAIYGAKRLKVIYENWMRCITSKENADTFINLGSNLRKDLKEQLENFEFYWRRDYMVAEQNIRKKPENQRTDAEKKLLVFMNDSGKELLKDISIILNSPIDFFTLKEVTKLKELNLWVGNAVSIVARLDLSVDYLHQLILLETEAADMEGMIAARDEQSRRIGAIEQDTNPRDVLDSASPLREHFMMLKLKEMGTPSLAVMGSAHEQHLAAKSEIPDGKYYSNYDDFVNETTSKVT